MSRNGVAYRCATMNAGDERVPTVDLNADVGETEGDVAMLTVVTSASIACGVHAGSPSLMRSTARAAVARGVVIGAHPSYADREGFGRRELGTGAEQIADEVCYQVGALQAVAALEGGAVSYVKLHGALYHRASLEEDVASTIAQALAAIGRFAVLAPSGSALFEASRQLGLPVATEGFCDRAYRPDGTLADRAEPGAVIEDPAQAAARAIAIVLRGGVDRPGGGVTPVEAASLCLHGDTPRALDHARSIRAALEQAGVSIAAFAPLATSRLW